MYSFHSSVNYERLTLPKTLLTPETIIVRSDGMIHKAVIFSSVVYIVVGRSNHLRGAEVGLLRLRLLRTMGIRQGERWLRRAQGAATEELLSNT